MLYAVGFDLGKTYIDNYEKLGAEHASEFLGPEEARTRFSGIFRDANWTDVKENYFNPRSGWGEATGALTSLIKAAVDEGVKFRTVTVSKLLFSNSNDCVGVSLEGREELRADNVLLSVGAWTPLLLANSAPDNQLLQAGDRMVAAAALQCTAKYPPEEAEKFKDAPVIVNTMPHTNGECIPPTKENRLKFNLEVTFTNKSYHEASKQTISAPPKPTADNAWGQAVPQSLKDEIATVVKNTDAITPNQDFIITPHPHSKGLYIATGGSFHSWKFMPIIGEYVVKMMQGTLPADIASRWAWDRSSEGSALKEYLPKRDLKDIK
ncbi:putative sarcosine oxidase protein [Phaeoacremonium minimum UCRPA7]|uniref:Putative sarcosine oxidase protein n=1 Tax=Phaeoacremonium minimum (strain UCR-PA7) TaxID=1286976 RepID=R8BLA0_PHAM7|nr:putative sarcosine oxidase protein [Phaeoacremonium minimum UCRPA7]EOO00129.1 putative sarcosine oxidase protein [Phaeoacremonium minimum UCRPA7]